MPITSMHAVLKKKLENERKGSSAAIIDRKNYKWLVLCTKSIRWLSTQTQTKFLKPLISFSGGTNYQAFLKRICQFLNLLSQSFNLFIFYIFSIHLHKSYWSFFCFEVNNVQWHSRFGISILWEIMCMWCIFPILMLPLEWFWMYIIRISFLSQLFKYNFIQMCIDPLFALHHKKSFLAFTQNCSLLQKE